MSKRSGAKKKNQKKTKTETKKGGFGLWRKLSSMIDDGRFGEAVDK